MCLGINWLRGFLENSHLTTWRRRRFRAANSFEMTHVASPHSPKEGGCGPPVQRMTDRKSTRLAATKKSSTIASAATNATNNAMTTATIAPNRTATAANLSPIQSPRRTTRPQSPPRSRNYPPEPYLRQVFHSKRKKFGAVPEPPKSPTQAKRWLEWATRR